MRRSCRSCTTARPSERATALAQLAARLGTSGAAVETLVELGDPDDVLLRIAADRGARLIVDGAVGRCGARWLGSTAEGAPPRARWYAVPP